MISADMTGLTIEFDLITSLLLAMVVLFVGRALVSRVAILGRLNIPAPVVGGGLVAHGRARGRHPPGRAGPPRP